MSEPDPADEGDTPLDARSEGHTRRPDVPALDALIGVARPVLDHGFVRLIDYMGDDAAIVQAARVSYGRGTKTPSGDRGLIRYLMRHRHTTPFEMCEIKLHVKLPIFVARQWIRHRTANVNEYSARYSVLDREFYVPDLAQLAAQSDTNRQGRGAALPEDAAGAHRDRIARLSDAAYAAYQALLGDGDDGSDGDGSIAPPPGLSRELARTVLPVNYYTQWYWKVDLHNLLQFLSLRADAHAQYEIRAYAEVILDLVRSWVPLTYEAFLDYRLGAVTLSRPALAAVRALLGPLPEGDPRLAGLVEAHSLPPREWRELLAALRGP